ncbi:uncharacterized protein B0T15DRAFT_496998 [Chaetomium strumarium]|uniref:Uncharacterized protein n=1 Tax=Chaetomium strumarium TaxID=1170767 RepID=A0AAJ0LYN9_9PEZI|nr:hypothetical protein B0T15DRAFT_496998 [Chaetomium strumarium]
MAPGASSVPSDRLRAQILENCAFFSELYARFWLIVSKEPLGDFKAIVVKTVDGNREAVLSEKAPSYQDALEALFVRSAEAVQNYIATNGFACVSNIGKQTPKHTGGHGGGDESDTDSSSTVNLSECESLSDDETVSVTSVGRLKKRRGRKADKSAKTASSTKAKPRQPRSRARSPSVLTDRARSRSSSSSSSGDELHYGPPTLPSACAPHGGAGCRTWPLRAVPTTPWPLPKASSAFTAGHPPPPPPPPPQPASAGGNQSSGSGTAPARPPPPSFMGLKPPVGQPTSVTPLRDVILEIRWRGHGERRVLHQMPQLSLARIRDAALTEVRRQPSTWLNAPGLTSPHVGNFSLTRRLRATVKDMVLDGVEYGLTGWAGDDLTRLIGLLRPTRDGPGSGGGLPKFEVEVWEDNSNTSAHGEWAAALEQLRDPIQPPAPPPVPWAAGGRGPSAQRPMQPPHIVKVDGCYPHNQVDHC